MSAVFVGGCADAVAVAGFPARPDTVLPGDVLGPFTGQVLDGATGKPISGAVVWAGWSYMVGRGLTAPAGGFAETVETDSDGRYFLPRLARLPGGRARVERVTVVAYKRGYLGFRSDRRFDDGAPRLDFSQRDAVLKLDRFPDGASHVKHVRFIGGSGALRRALEPEIVQASLELGGRAPRGVAAPGKPLLDAFPLLSLDELRAVTGYDGDFSVERLADLPQSPSYDSKHFRAIDKPESYDAAIRVWKLGSPAEADAKLDELAKTIPHAELGSEAGDRSLRGYDGRILAAAAEEKERGLVLELTCGVDLCRDGDQAMALLKRVLARAERLGAAGPEGEKAGPEGEAGESAEPGRGSDEKKPEEPPAPAPQDEPFRLKPPELKR